MMDRAIVLAGPSAVGKTTVVKYMLDTTDDFYFLRSATTREKRGDAFDNEYIYLSREEFLSRIERGEMLEYTEHSGNFYGTPLSEIEKAFSENKIPLLILDINGIESLKSKKRDFETVGVYVYDELEILEKRLFERELAVGENEAGRARYEKRIKQNRDDYLSLPRRSKLFDIIVRNARVEDTANKILAYFRKNQVMPRIEIEHVCNTLAKSVK